MTTDELAHDYFRRAKVRRRVLDLLFEAGEYADVVREAQELVELSLKGMLRWAGIDPPRWHDVGAVLESQRERLPDAVRGPVLATLVKASSRLRKEREMAFYGEIDLIPFLTRTAERERESVIRRLTIQRVDAHAVRGADHIVHSDSIHHFNGGDVIRACERDP